mgnify:CR=1 FL=1
MFFGEDLMDSHRFYVTGLSEIGSGSEIELNEYISRQIIRVLRMRTGDSIKLFDGSGTEWEAKIVGINGTSVQVAFCNVFNPNVESKTRLNLCPALVSSDRLEFVFQKGSELGVASFSPVISERVQKKDLNPSHEKIKRWNRIIIEACEQSGRVKIPAISPAMNLLDVVSIRAEIEPVVILWEMEKETGIIETLRKFISKVPDSITLIIGPVGGFSHLEINQSLELGAKVVGLGSRVLRSETAAIVASSIIMAELDQLGG